MIAQAASADQAPHIPGEAGIWIVIFGELTVFSVLFVNFALFRTRAPGGKLGRATNLEQSLGCVNTALLLTSSWFVVSGLAALRQSQFCVARRKISAAIACGLGFVALKMFEYSVLLTDGITPQTNIFYMYYFVYTGLHLLHVAAGLLILLWIHSRIAGENEPPKMSLIESGATFWHMVDLIWIILFPLMYFV